MRHHDSDAARKAPPLDIELTDDFMYSLKRGCSIVRGEPMSQAALKFFQAFPIAYSGLAYKESEKMSAKERNAKMTRTYMEFACPGFIKLCYEAQRKDPSLPFPLDFEIKMYQTTLGTGKGTAVSFAENEATLFTKWGSIKRELTKGHQLWFDTHQEPANDLPSGHNTEDALKELEEAMYKESSQAKQQLTKVAAAQAASLPHDGLPAAAGGLRTGEGAAGAGAGPGAEGGGLSLGEGTEEAPLELGIPDGWVYPYLVLACAWTPWGGCTPGEWKDVMSSDGPAGRARKRKSDSQNPAEAITLDGENPIHSPSAIYRLNPNGDKMSGAHHYTAIKAENRDAIKRLLATKEAMSTAMQEGNANVEAINANLARMVALKEAEGVAAARQEKVAARKEEIATLEKMLIFGLGDTAKVRADMQELLNPNGDEMSRAHHYKAIKEENRDAIKRSLATKEAMLTAMREGNANVEAMNANLARMVALKEVEGVAAARQEKIAARNGKIAALEKMLVFGLGDTAKVKADMQELLIQA